MSQSILKVQDLNVIFNNGKKTSHLIKNLSFELQKGQCLGILGESGSGKSIAMKAIMGILDRNFQVSGSIVMNNKDLTKESKDSIRKMRGKGMTMILQNPMVCFDSLYRIDYQIKETFQEHTDWNAQTIKDQSIELLKKMKIKDPNEVLRKYPHQLSGGMLQRIMIGIALALEPDLIIADEPTTAIDSITRHSIMQEFKSLKEQKTTMIFITHDLSTASYLADNVLVMKSGEGIDFGTVDEIMNHPKDAYTKELIDNKMALSSAYQKILGGMNAAS